MKRFSRRSGILMKMLNVLLVGGGLLIGASHQRVFAQEDSHNLVYLHRVVQSLSAYDQPAEIILFLRNEFPDFFKILSRSRIDEFLNGTKDTASLETSWNRERDRYLAEGGKLKRSMLDKLFHKLIVAVAKGVELRTPSTIAGPRASAKTVAPSVATIRNELLKSTAHPLARGFGEHREGWQKLRHVDVVDASDDLELIWVNDSIAIPSLGIKPGTALTQRQREALVTLFGVRPVSSIETGATDADAKRIGSVLFPSDVGRTVNTNRGAVTIIDAESGELLPELSLSGTGKLPLDTDQRVWTSNRKIGSTSKAEGIMKSEVGRALQTRRARDFVSVAVLRWKTDPDHVIHIRASDSIVRFDPHLTNSQYTTSASWDVVAPRNERERRQMLLLLDHLVETARLTRGRKGPNDVAAWANEFIPKQHGLMAGIAAESGFRRQNGYHAGNIAPGRMVDFGEAAITLTPLEANETVEFERKGMKGLVELAMDLGVSVDMNAALKRFDRYVRVGRRYARMHKTPLQISRDALMQHFDADHFKDLTGSLYTDRSRFLSADAPFEQQRHEFSRSPYVFDSARHDRLLKSSRATLVETAKTLGVKQIPRLNRAQLTREILRRETLR